MTRPLAKQATETRGRKKGYKLTLMKLICMNPKCLHLFTKQSPPYPDICPFCHVYGSVVERGLTRMDGLNNNRSKAT